MILVTGATGNVGTCLVRQLVAAGERVRAINRNPETAQLPPGVEVLYGDLTSPDTLAPAFDGIQRMFFFTPAAGGPAVVEAARKGGVRRVVVLSSTVTQKADPRSNPIAARHDAVERAVQASGMAWTLLRPDTFAANALAWAPSIRSESVVRAAYALAQRNPVHEDDIAAVASAALRDDRHVGACYTLTGPASITQIEQANMIGEAIGREVRFEELTHEQALVQLLKTTPAGIAERLLAYAEKSVTTAPALTRHVEQVTGRPARSFLEWAKDHAAAFR